MIDYDSFDVYGVGDDDVDDLMVLISLMEFCVQILCVFLRLSIGLRCLASISPFSCILGLSPESFPPLLLGFAVQQRNTAFPCSFRQVFQTQLPLLGRFQVALCLPRFAHLPQTLLALLHRFLADNRRTTTALLRAGHYDVDLLLQHVIELLLTHRLLLQGRSHRLVVVRRQDLNGSSTGDLGMVHHLRLSTAARVVRQLSIVCDQCVELMWSGGSLEDVSLVVRVWIDSAGWGILVERLDVLQLGWLGWNKVLDVTVVLGLVGSDVWRKVRKW